MTDSEYSASVSEITAVDGVEVDITVRGQQDKADKVLMELKDRLGWVGEAFETETPPDELTNRDDDRTPLMTVAWDRLFNDD